MPMNQIVRTGLWWERDDLGYRGGRLTFAGRDVGDLARSTGTPAFFYSAARIETNVRRVHDALSRRKLDFAIRYAMKANRFGPILTHLKQTGLVGIDVCSPAELLFARSCGFEQAEISYTNTSVSTADLDVIARNPDIWVNADSMSTIRRLAQVSPGRKIGIRVNPALGVGYGENELLRYSGQATTKFGIYREQFDEALALAKAGGLTVAGIHFHVGCGYMNPQLDAWKAITEECRWFLDRLDAPETVNIGGGIGLPHTATDTPIDLDRWAGLIDSAFGGHGLRILVEPGDYIVKDAGMLLLEVNTVERKRRTTFVGVNGGFNLAMEPVFYKLPVVPALCSLPRGDVDLTDQAGWEPVTIAGNINEALDIWAEDVPLPAVAEGDLMAMINAGGYGSAMSSNHCMRGQFAEYLLF
jgi:diaminopimelate decarboxylase